MPWLSEGQFPLRCKPLITPSDPSKDRSLVLPSKIHFPISHCVMGVAVVSCLELLDEAGSYAYPYPWSL